MKYLFVMAHPDDEADVGGMIWRLSTEGNEIAVAVTVGKVEARRNLSNTLEQEEQASMELLGVCKVYHADFPNIRTNTVPHLDMVEFIVGCIRDFGAEVVVTHHTADVNIDHVMTGKAAMSAINHLYRFQPMSQSQQTDNYVFRLRMFLLCETAGATEWAINSSLNRFQPNYYVEIGEEGLRRKMHAHYMYKGVMRQFPHPQSNEVYAGLAAFRGSQCGCRYAEAYECVFQTL